MFLYRLQRHTGARGNHAYTWMDQMKTAIACLGTGRKMLYLLEQVPSKLAMVCVNPVVDWKD